MAELGHVYMTAHGEWTSAAWLGEKAQIGLRLPIVDDSAMPAVGSVFTPVSNGDVVQDTGTFAGTNGTLTRTWTARRGPITSTDNMDAAAQADLADDFWAFLNAVKTYQHTSFKWTHVKIAPVLTDGKYGAPSALYQFTAPVVGGNSNACLPPEVALAVTFRAPVIGRRGRGRFYLPALTSQAVVTGDGTVLGTTASGIVGMAVTLLSNIDNMPGTESYSTVVGVMSAGSATAVRPAQVRVGNHFDVQRRRQHQVIESYTTTAL